MRRGAETYREGRGRFARLSFVVAAFGLCLGACDDAESKAEPQEEADRGDLTNRDAAKEQRHPSGWGVLDGGALFSPNGLLVPQEGTCPDGWRLVAYQPGCFEDAPAMMCADEERYACYELRCSCQGIVVTGCKTFAEPFWPGALERADASPREGEPCEPSER